MSYISRGPAAPEPDAAVAIRRDAAAAIDHAEVRGVVVDAAPADHHKTPCWLGWGLGQLAGEGGCGGWLGWVAGVGGWGGWLGWVGA